MDLKTFLKWEEPQKAYGSSSEPQIYLGRHLDDKLKPSNGRIVINAAWMKENMPEIPQGENIGVPVAIHVDRKQKFFVILFNPPKEVPQYVGRLIKKASSSVTIANKMLVDDLWFSLELPINVTKQFLESERFMAEKDEKVKMFKITYDPREAINMQIQSKAKVGNKPKTK